MGMLGCVTSDAMKSALDDCAGSWFEYFGEARDLIERMWGTLAAFVDVGSWSYAAVAGAIKRGAAKGAEQLLISSARRGACVHLGVSADLAEFVLTDADLRKLVTSIREDSASSTTPRAPRAPTWSRCTDQASFWPNLLEDVKEAMIKRVRRERRGFNLLLDTGMDMILHSSLGQIFALDTHRSAKEKAGLYAASVLGSFVLVAAFFQGTGLVSKRPSVESVACEGAEEDGAAARIGRFLVIAIASFVIAGLPVSILESFMTKTIKKVEGPPGSPAWNRQLSAWRHQQRLFWSFSILFDCVCVGYLSIFIANIDPDDYADFMFAAGLGLLEDLVILPMLLATAIPISSKLWASAYSRAANIPRQELVQRTCVALYRESNLMLPLEHL